MYVSFVLGDNVTENRRGEEFFLKEGTGRVLVSVEFITTWHATNMVARRSE